MTTSVSGHPVSWQLQYWDIPSHDNIMYQYQEIPSLLVLIAFGSSKRRDHNSAISTHCRRTDWSSFSRMATSLIMTTRLALILFCSRAKGARHQQVRICANGRHELYNVRNKRSSDTWRLERILIVNIIAVAVALEASWVLQHLKGKIIYTLELTMVWNLNDWKHNLLVWECLVLLP